MISRYPFCRAQGPTSCPGVVILAVAFPGRHLDQRRSRKPPVGVSGKLKEGTGTVIARVSIPATGSNAYWMGSSYRLRAITFSRTIEFLAARLQLFNDFFATAEPEHTDRAALYDAAWALLPHLWFKR